MADHIRGEPVAFEREWSHLAFYPEGQGAIEVHVKAGDAILFVDALCHGSARRVRPGERRISVYRYSSAATRTRFGHHPSPELLARLGPMARKLVHPRDYVRPPGTEARR